VEIVKMKPWGPFTGHCKAWAAQHTFSGCWVYLTHLSWLLGLPSAPFVAAGQR